MELPQILLALGIPGIAIICWALTSIVESWQKSRRIEHETALKQQMIERGMSAEDIAQVLRKGNGHADADRQRAVASVGVGELLAAHGFVAEDMVKVIQAAHGASPAVLAVVKGMVENDYTADDMVKVLRASPGQEQLPSSEIHERPWAGNADIKR